MVAASSLALSAQYLPETEWNFWHLYGKLPSLCINVGFSFLFSFFLTFLFFFKFPPPPPLLTLNFFLGVKVKGLFLCNHLSLKCRCTFHSWLNCFSSTAETIPGALGCIYKCSRCQGRRLIITASINNQSWKRKYADTPLAKAWSSLAKDSHFFSFVYLWNNQEGGTFEK